MTTPRIEQYVAEFDELLNFAESHLGVSERERLTKAFKEVEKDTLDEAVEIINSMKRNQDAPKESDPHFTGCGGCGKDYPAICGCREVNQALDDTIKTLQDNKE